MANEEVWKRRFRLSQLLNLTYTSRSGLSTAQHLLTYAQGWTLVYFCNYFDVDANGMVRIGKRGKYADGFEKYLKAELEGRTGRAVFMECLSLDDASLKKMDEEFAAYCEWLVHKLKLKHYKDKRLIPAAEHRNSRGESTGTAEDDLLIRPKKKAETDESGGGGDK